MRGGMRILFVILFSGVLQGLMAMECTQDQFANYVRRADRLAFDCSNLREIVNEELNYGQRPLHIAILKRHTTHKDFLETLIDFPYLNYNVIDDNNNTPLVNLVKSYRNDDDSLMIKLSLRTSLNQVNKAMVATQFGQYSKNESDELRVRLHVIDTLYDTVFSPERINQSNPGLATVYSYLSGLLGSMRPNDQASPERLAVCINQLFNKLVLRFDLESTVRALFNVAAQADKKIGYMVNSRTYVSMLLHHKKFDTPYPSTESEQVHFFNAKVDSILIVDREDELNFLVQEKGFNLQANDPLNGDDVIGLSLEYNSPKCLMFALDRSNKTYFNHRFQSDRFDYLHRAIDSQSFFMFKVLIDKLIQLGLRAEISRWKNYLGVTAYVYVANLSLANEKHADYSKMKLYMEELGINGEK